MIRAGDLVVFDCGMVGPFSYGADISRAYRCGPGRPSDHQKTLYTIAHVEPMRQVPGQLVAQLLDQDRLCPYLGQKPRGEAAQLLGVFRQSQGPIEHAGSLSHCIPCGNH